MGGWLFHYSLKCQPVDYSDDPIAVRVSLLSPYRHFFPPTLPLWSLYTLDLQTYTNMGIFIFIWKYSYIYLYIHMSILPYPSSTKEFFLNIPPPKKRKKGKTESTISLFFIITILVCRPKNGLLPCCQVQPKELKKKEKKSRTHLTQRDVFQQK